MSINTKRVPFSFATIVLSTLLQGPLTAEETSQLKLPVSTTEDRLKEAGSAEAAEQFAEAGKFQNEGDYEKARRAWLSFLKQHADDPLAVDAHHYLGICLLQKQQYAPAAKHLQQVLDEADNEELHEEALVSLAWCHYSLGATSSKLDPSQIRLAAECFERHTQQYPDSATIDDSYFYLGESFNLLSEFKRASDAYEVVIQQHPQSVHRPYALISAAFVNRSAGRFQQAAACYERLANEFPEEAQQPDARLNYADALAAMQRIGAAERVFAELARDDQLATLEYVMFRQAGCLEQLEAYEAAADVYMAYARRFADSETAGSASLNAGRNYLSAGQTAEAQAALEEALTRDGAHQAAARHWMCHVLLRQGATQRAVDWAEAALQVPELTPVEQLRAELDLAEAQATLAGTPDELFARFDRLLSEPDPLVQPREQKTLIIGTAIRTAIATDSSDELERYGQQLIAELGDHPQAAGVERLLVDHHLEHHEFNAAATRLSGMIERYPEHPQQELWQLQLAAAQFRTGKFEEAIVATQRLIDSQPLEVITPSEVRCIAGAAHLELGDLNRAVAELEAGLAAEPRAAVREKMLIQLAEAQRQLGEFTAAREALQTLLQADEPAPERRTGRPLRLALAGLAGIAGDRDLANQMMEQLGTGGQTEPHPQPVPTAAELDRGWLAIQNAEIDAAREVFTRIIERDDVGDAHLAAAYYGRALAASRQQLNSEALVDLEQYFGLADTQFREDALTLKSECEIAAKNWEAVELALRQLIAEFPESTRREEALGRHVAASIRLGRLEAAKESARELHRQFEQSKWLFRGWHAIADREFESGQFEAAAESYLKAVTAADAPEQAESGSYRRGWALFQAGKFAVAATVFDAQRVEFANGPLADRGQFMQAESMFKLRQFEESLAHYESLVRRGALENELAVLALLHGSECYRALEKPEQAVAYLEQIMEQHPDSVYRSKAVYELGNTYLQLEQPARAIQPLQEAANSGKVEIAGRAYFSLGKAYFGLREFEQARKAFGQLMATVDAPQMDDSKLSVWQARAGLESARCSQIMANQARQRLERRAHAKAMADALRFVIERFPTTAEAKAAERQMERLRSALQKAGDADLLAK